MRHLAIRLRGLAIASVVLALSAGVAFAAGGPPAVAQAGLDRAAEASGKDVPVRAGWNETEPEEPLAEEEPLAGDEPLAEEEALEEPEDADASDNHGALVSEAAQMETPDGFANHGAFVSCVARMNRGHLDAEELAALADLDLAALTATDCEPDADDEGAAELGAGSDVQAAGNGHGKSMDAKSRGAKGKARGR